MLTLWDVGVAAALRRRNGPQGDLLAHPSPSAGVLHLFDCDLTGYASERLSIREGFTQPTRFPGWRPGRGLPQAGPVPTGLGLVCPEAPPALVTQVAVGVAFAISRTTPGRVVASVSPPGIVASGAWHEAIAVASAARASFISVTGPAGKGVTGDFGFDMARAARAHGATYEEATADVLSAYAVTRRAVARARSHQGLQFVRLVPPRSSRADERDALRDLALSRGLASAADISAMDQVSAAIASRVPDVAVSAA